MSNPQAQSHIDATVIQKERKQAGKAEHEKRQKNSHEERG